jgi:hypothetical protein
MQQLMPSYQHIWDQVKVRLHDDPTLQTRMYGPGHVYLEGESYEQPERSNALPWCRLVVAAAVSLWPEPEAPGPLVQVAFIVRAECNRFQVSGYDHQLALEGLHVRVNQLLSGWAPPPIDGKGTRIIIPIHVRRPIDPRPMWDEGRGVFFVTAEYHAEASTIS